MTKKLQKPGQKPQKPGEYVERGPRGGQVSNPRQVTIEPGDALLPPTQTPRHTWVRVGLPNGRAGDLGRHGSGISPQLHCQLRTVLVDCDSFVSDRGLMAIFVDERLSPWRNRLPQADNIIGRVEKVIDFLHNQYDAQGENALVLLLHVLSTRYDPGDACHQRLADLASEFEQKKIRPRSY